MSDENEMVGGRIVWGDVYAALQEFRRETNDRLKKAFAEDGMWLLDGTPGATAYALETLVSETTTDALELCNARVFADDSSPDIRGQTLDLLGSIVEIQNRLDLLFLSIAGGQWSGHGLNRVGVRALMDSLTEYLREKRNADAEAS